MTTSPSLIICPENYPWLARRIMHLAYKRRIPRWLLPLAWRFTGPRRGVQS